MVSGDSNGAWLAAGDYADLTEGIAIDTFASFERAHRLRKWSRRLCDGGVAVILGGDRC